MHSLHTRTESKFLKWLSATLIKGGNNMVVHAILDMVPPSFFNVPKWKSQECHPEAPLLKWRDVI